MKSTSKRQITQLCSMASHMRDCASPTPYETRTSRSQYEWLCRDVCARARRALGVAASPSRPQLPEKPPMNTLLFRGAITGAKTVRGIGALLSLCCVMQFRSQKTNAPSDGSGPKEKNLCMGTLSCPVSPFFSCDHSILKLGN